MSTSHMHQAGSVCCRLCSQSGEASCCAPCANDSLCRGVHSPAKQHLESGGGERGAGQDHAGPRLPVVAADLQGLCARQRAIHSSATLMWHRRRSGSLDGNSVAAWQCFHHASQWQLQPRLTSTKR